MTERASSSGNHANAILQVQNLGMSLGQGAHMNSVIEDMCFDAYPGEFLSIVGPSGCGKTTLLMCLAGLYRASAGRVVFEGSAIQGPPPGLAVVFQDYSRSLLPWKSNLDNVVFGMNRTTLMANEKHDKAMELLQVVGLTGFEKLFPWQVSGGMQQRVAIARGLAAQSRLLLLDEPLAAVDAQTRAELQDLLLELAERFGQTCLLVTHDVDEAVYMADRVIVLSRRPTHVVQDLRVELPKPREQLRTREHAEFLRLRAEVVTLIRSMRVAA